MRLLLDTHTFLWFVQNDPQLSESAATLIEGDTNEIWLSVASAWEMAIKVSIGKLVLAQPLDIYLPDQLRRNGIQLLPISLPRVLGVTALPLHHQDPFDRLLAAQSLTEPMPLISTDAIFDLYGTQRLW